MIARGCVIGGDWITDLSTRLIGSGRVRIVGRATGVDIKTNLVNRWPLISNANDVVGTLHLTNTGSVTFSSEGALFDGSTQYLRVSKLSQSVGTVSLWIRPLVYGAKCPASWGKSSGSVPALGVYSNSDNTMAATLYGNPVTLGGVEFTNPNFPETGYTNILFKFNTTTSLKAYIGGIKRSGEPINSGSSSNTFVIGASGESVTARRFVGYIKDVRIYSVELTDTQIATLVANGPNP